MAKITLANGITIEGVSEETLKSLVSGSVDGIHYNSNSRGRIAISSMATPHLKNAVLKNLRAELEDLKNASTIRLLTELRNGLGSKDITTIAMVNELRTRRD